jgi:RNA polymerase sigma-70 factor (ECF subfamily)
MEESDADIVRRVCEGEIEAYRVLVDRHSESIFRLAYRMTGNEHDAKDVVQEAFLRAYRGLGAFESRASFSTWLHRIAANFSMNLLRQRQRNAAARGPDSDRPAEEFGSLPSSAPTPDGEAFNLEVQQKMQSVLEDLSPQERAAFILRHFENRSIEEIGFSLGLGTSAAKHSVFRAVQKMRRALEPFLNPTK